MSNPRIVVIALKPFEEFDVDKFRDFHDLEPQKKTLLIAEHIRKVAKHLHELENSFDESKRQVFSHWIIGFGEYTICGQSVRFIFGSDRKDFKEKIDEVKKEFPKLTIFAGTISTMRTFNFDSERLQNIAKCYQNNANNFDYHDNEHLKMVMNLQSSINQDKGFSSVRNVCYIFTEDGRTLIRDKVVPFEHELCPTKYSSPLSNTIFQPGSKNDKKENIPIFFLKDNETSKMISMGDELCLENHEFILKKYCLKQNKAKLNLHFLISNTISPDLKSIHAEHFIQFDPFQPFCHIITEAHSKLSVDVIVYGTYY